MSTTTREQINIALQLHKSGDFVEAEKSYLKILDESLDNTDALNLLGMLKLQIKQFKDAIFYIQKATQIKPCTYYFENLGRAYFENRDFDTAISAYKKALEFSPNDFDVLFNLASAYKKNDELNNAITAYESALSVKPNHPDVLFNLANVYENKNDTPTALKYYQQAQEFGVKDKNINYFLAVSYLKTKDFKNGWEYYEDRPSKEFGVLTQSLQYKELMQTKPLLQIEDLQKDTKDKTLFVYYEAGLGDSIMYARYLPLLKEKFAKVVFKPQSGFVNLFKDSDLGAEIIDLPIQDMDFDFHIPLMSVPFVLQLNTEADIPFADKFLKTNPHRVGEFKEKYFNNDKFKIGIKWQGNPAYDKQRIIPIEAFSEIFKLPNTQFYSLQKDDGAQELKKIQKDINIIDLGPSFNNFTDTAAAMENLDLVICNDTSVAHLVGALGKPCWVMLPFVSNWRWHTDTSYSPWYKSVSLFKQHELNNWDKAFEQVHEELSKLI